MLQSAGARAGGEPLPRQSSATAKCQLSTSRIAVYKLGPQPCLARLNPHAASVPRWMKIRVYVFNQWRLHWASLAEQRDSCPPSFLAVVSLPCWDANQLLNQVPGAFHSASIVISGVAEALTRVWARTGRQPRQITWAHPSPLQRPQRPRTPPMP